MEFFFKKSIFKNLKLNVIEFQSKRSEVHTFPFLLLLANKLFTQLLKKCLFLAF